MKKIVLALMIICASAITVRAQMTQGDFTFGAGIHLGLPTGNLNTVTSFGLGGEVQAEYAFSENLTGVATSGYTYFFGKSFDNGLGGTYKVNYGHIPVIVGARFYPSEQIFVGAQIGYGHYSASSQGVSSSSGGFEYRPQVGYNADMFQFILSYDGVSVTGGSLAHIGLTALYKFGGGK
jgi:hypothetical protein